MDNIQVISKPCNGIKEEEWLKILMECIEIRISEGRMTMINALITRPNALLGFWETMLL